MLPEPNMRHSILFASLLPMIAPTSGFIIELWKDSANCSGPADYKYDFGSDGQCNVAPAAYSFKYHSQMGCVLSPWHLSNCGTSHGAPEAPHYTEQYTCFAPFVEEDNDMIYGVSCEVDD